MSKTTNKYSTEVRERAVRIVLDHEKDHPSRWATIESVASNIGCAPQTLHDWVGKTEINNGKRPGVTTDMAEKMEGLERENRELRLAHESWVRAARSCRKRQGICPLSRFAGKPLPGKGTELDRPYRK